MAYPAIPRKPGVRDCVAALYELPLGIASFVVFQILKYIVIAIGQMTYTKNPRAFACWRELSGENLSKPHQLSRYMVVAPRWNPHAAISAAGPIRVQREMVLNFEESVENVGYWFFGTFKIPSFAPAGYTSSLTVEKGKKKVAFDLAPGDYYIACRYYDWDGTLHYPAIWADGQEVISAAQAPANLNDFYPALHTRDTFFYRAAHFHIYVMLKYCGIFSERLIKRNLLPVGNEDTDYLYGVAEKGKVLKLTLDSALLSNDYRVFCTVYNTSSLPVFFAEAGGEAFETGPLPCKGIYLIRVMLVGKPGCPSGIDKVNVSIGDSTVTQAALPN